MRLRSCAWLVLLASSACYSPSIQSGAPCDPASNRCPGGQTCAAIGSGHFCVGPGDAGTGDGAPDDGGALCLGARLIGSVCLQQPPPTAPLAYLAAATINTASTTAGNCHELRAQAGGPSLCLVVASSISIASATTVRAIGPNPLVLLATENIVVGGTLDVASHIGETLDGKPALGAGARTALECNSLGVDGTTSADPDNGGGGAAGGSFGGIGGTGGNGNGGVPRGMPRPAGGSTVLVGGCPGGHGGGGAGNGGGGGAGGNGGGAVYLLAGETITITGKLNASGAGASPGSDGRNSSGGGGGGGAGGMIGVEAPVISVSGSVLANGGGGGGGGGDMFDRPGGPGGDPMVPLTAAPGGRGGTGGGGGGGAGPTTLRVGGNGSGGNNARCGGGGGGGGGGIVQLHGGTVMMTGAISPPPS
jgi:hypothetical protein